MSAAGAPPRRGAALACALLAALPGGAALGVGRARAEPGVELPLVWLDVSAELDPARAIADAVLACLGAPPDGGPVAAQVRGPAAPAADALAAALVAAPPPGAGEPAVCPGQEGRARAVPAMARLRVARAAARRWPDAFSARDLAGISVVRSRGPNALVVETRRAAYVLEVTASLFHAQRPARVPVDRAEARLHRRLRVLVPVAASFARWPGDVRVGAVHAGDVSARATPLPSPETGRWLALEAWRGLLVFAREREVGWGRLGADVRGRPELVGGWSSSALVEERRTGPASRWPIARIVPRDATSLEVRVAGRAPMVVAPGETTGVMDALPAPGTTPAAAQPPCDGPPMDPACVTRDAARAHWLARPWPGPHHALRARTLVPPGASAPVPYEVATTASGAIAARTPDGSSAAEGYGMALGVADLDADGRLDVLTSEARDPGAGDRLHLLRVEPDGRLVHVWRSAPLAGSVYVGAGGDADGDGREELLAVEEPTTPGAPATLWVVR